MNAITRTALKELLDKAAPVTIVDVDTGEEYAAHHLPGAMNCCVYEVVFVEKIAAVVPDKGAAIVLYGSSSHSLASLTAQDKLIRAGYTDVRDFRAGLADWEQAGLPVERGPAAPQPETPRLGRHEIDLQTSKLQWTGRNINGAHTGVISLQSGWIDVTGECATGEFVLDMNSIVDTDLSDSTYNRMLIAHLKSDDFFDTALYPTATFLLTQVTFDPNARPGHINADIIGTLTLKGVTDDLAFPAIIEVLPGGALTAEAHFDINRTRWNVIYGSGKFYEKLGKHLVHDLISLALRIVTK